MTVLEYVARFTEFARFRDDYVATDAAKVRKFEDGLKLSIRGKIVGHNLQDMDSMVSTTLIIEREVDDARSIRDAGASNKKRGGAKLLLQARERSRGLLFHEGFRGGAVVNRAKGQVWVTSQAGKMTCFHCHQSGHMRRNCLQIQGFQDQGTPQSRSSVGHEQTQYVPPYPSTGQGNRYQSQGATRASSVSQTGQRG